jgi:hypothetical protein
MNAKQILGTKFRLELVHMSQTMSFLRRGIIFVTIEEQCVAHSNSTISIDQLK